MKYEEKSFSIPLGGRKFGEAYDVVFNGACDCKDHSAAAGKCKPCPLCGMRVRPDGWTDHAKRCNPEF